MVPSSFTPHHKNVLPERHLSICDAEKLMVQSSFLTQDSILHLQNVLPQEYVNVCVAEKPVVRSSFLTQPASGQQEEAKRHGGIRSIMLQPPVFLLFDDPAGAHGTQEDERVVAGRIAKIRSASELSLLSTQFCQPANQGVGLQ